MMGWRRNKGFVIEGATILAVVLTLAFVALWKPLSSTVGSFIGSTQAQHQRKSTYKKTESIPVYFKDADGKEHLVPYTKFEESTNFIIEEPQLTLWQKIKNLGTFGVVLVVLGILFPQFGMILLFIWKRVSGALKKTVETANNKIEDLKNEQDLLTSDAKLIVKSIDEGLAAMDAVIAAAKGQAEAAQSALTLSVAIVDVTARAASAASAQHSLAVAQAVLTAVTNLKKDFLSAMSRKQDSTTKLLVSELKND